MKAIDAALLAVQQNPRSAAPIARASLADNGRLHLERLSSGSWAGGYTRTANCGSFFVRARTVPAGTKVQVQKITDPAAASQWTAWTDLDTNNAGVFALAVFWTGAYVVVAYQDATTLNIVYRRSTDGLAWEPEANAYTGLAPHGAYLGGASGGSGQSGIMLSYNYQLYWGAYNPGANTWAALSSAGLSMTSAVVEGDVLYDSANSRHVFAYAPNGLVRWSRFGLVIQARSTAGSWGTPRVYLQSDNLGCRYISLSPAQINGRWWLSFARETAWGSDVFWLASSADGVHWEEPLVTDIDANGHANLLGTMSGQAGAWLATERQVYRANAQTFWTNRPVVRYAFTTGDAAHRVGGGRAPHLTVVVDNRDGALGPGAPGTTPALNAVLTLERGYRSAGVDYYQSAGRYYVSGFRYQADDQLLAIDAIDSVGLLTTFVSDTAYNFEGETVQALVTLLCALAGVPAVSFDGSPLWAGSVAAFTHPANENGRVSLESLAERVPFDYRLAEDGTLHFFVPAAGPAVNETYGAGAGQHRHWPGEFGEANAPNYARVIGAPARTVGGEAARQAAVYAAGRRHTHYTLDRRVKTSGDAAELAAAQTAQAAERARAGYCEAPPNLRLEVGDVIAFSGSQYSATAGPWRVTQIQEVFNHHSRRRFFQRLWLRGTA